MRAPSSRDHNDRRDDQAMTPMIDVVFLLLIFFVCASAGQVHESLLPTKLAAGDIASPAATPPERPLGEVWLHLKQDGSRTRIELNDRLYDDFDAVGTTLKALAAAAPEIPVILDIDGEVPLGEMIHAYDICRTAGFETVSFAAEPQKAGPKVE